VTPTDPTGPDPFPDAWYQDAVFYEVSVKAFFDSNGDGIGDFPGLIQKLDYVRELGATCVWLLPFYPSPLRDDGYDVADYRDVHPAYGTMADFRAFVREAHARGLRVAAEMVVNHTSDQHPWFQAARAAPPGSPLRDFYTWADSGDRFRSAAIRYADAERSNWTWDPVANAYYWHRFYGHQPDLNFDSPLVRREVLAILRFWLDQGVDALCLNGAPYLVERDGTTCEHLPETHALLKEFRRELGAGYPAAVLLAGVNAWPTEARTYFGDGDECQLAPNLPLAQRLFQAVRQEDRHPVASLLRDTPPPPAGCQWVTLLRNHDELTLTLATDEERDYMFREYAADPLLRRHAGILRRLAPLADNSRRKIELLFGLLLSLPGAPVIYYGDELGTGDNPALGGRTGVRTPMPWSADRNAGFSAADPARLYAPPVADPVFGYQAVNVEAQRRDPSSLFHWVRRQVALRKRSPALSRGSLELLEPENRKVLAFVRRLGAERVLVVANLSRTTQPAELDLSAFAGLIPVELFGRAVFPRVGTTPYLLTLGPHAFYWFELRSAAEDVTSRLAPVETEAVAAVPTVAVPGDWGTVLAGPSRAALERDVFPGFLRAQRWFGGKTRTIESVSVADWGELRSGAAPAFLTLLDVRTGGGHRDLYFVPLAVTAGGTRRDLGPLTVAHLRGPDGYAVLHDALADGAVCSALLAAAGEGRPFSTRSGRVRGLPTAAFARLRGDPTYPLPVVQGPATSSNSLVFFGRRLLLKLFRRLEEGTNPDFEVGRFLTEGERFSRTPAVAGAFGYERGDGTRYTLGILQQLVPNQGDGWRHAVEELGRYYDRATARMSGPDPMTPDPRPLPELSTTDPPPAALETIGTYLHAAATLGRRTAEMHLALSADQSDPAFAPEPMTAADTMAIRDEVAAQAQRAVAALEGALGRLPSELVGPARRFLAVGVSVAGQAVPPGAGVPHATKIRIHGDYHLGQVLWVDNDYVILDFEGEPARTVEDRRRKFSPIRDVAGMIRSYHYAAYAGLFAATRHRPDDFPMLVPWAESWFQWVAASFLRTYRATAGPAPFVPRRTEEFAELLDTFLLSKALYELVYELNNRPDWVRIPLGGVLALMGR